MKLRRVLLVEDDPSIRRFVSMALEPLPVELSAVESMAEAWRQLTAGRFDLVVTDLRLPDGSGLTLCEELSVRAGAAGAARIVLFSASIPARVRAQPETHGVWRVLDKPASLVSLLDVVCEALAVPKPPERTLPDPLPGGGLAALTDTAADANGHRRAHAIATHFAGHARLFDEFRASSLRQFVADVEQGDAAFRARDAAALRREAHNLKTVLQLLGQQEASDCARTLEKSAAAQAGWDALQAQWTALRTAVRALH